MRHFADMNQMLIVSGLQPFQHPFQNVLSCSRADPKPMADHRALRLLKSLHFPLLFLIANFLYQVFPLLVSKKDLVFPFWKLIPPIFFLDSILSPASSGPHFLHSIFTPCLSISEILKALIHQMSSPSSYRRESKHLFLVEFSFSKLRYRAR